MKENLDFIKDMCRGTALPSLILDEEGSILFKNDAFTERLPALSREGSISFIFPKEINEKLLSSDFNGSIKIPGMNFSVIKILTEGFILLNLIEETKDLREDPLSSLLLPVPHVFRSSISEMLMTVSSIYAMGELNENDKLMDMAKSLNLNCYKMLRGNNLVNSYVRELTSSSQEDECVDLARLVKTTSEAAGVLANEKGLTLTINTPDEIVPVSGNEVSLTEAFLHILDNAVKFSPKGGKIKIKLTKTSSNALISITDEGTGIPGNIMDDIFKPYFTYDRDREPLYGVGLGLTLARLISLKAGGNISVSSKEYEGTTVVMTLPIKKDMEDLELNSKISLSSLLRDRFSSLQVIFSDNDVVPLP